MIPFELSALCDAVVMLTWSDWFTEPRSNRFHYATRFALHVPVIFIQPDLERDGYLYEETEIPGITVLHVSQIYGEAQNHRMNLALSEKGIRKPLLWIYNSYFSDYISERYAVMKIYHATEDYFNHFPINRDAEFVGNLMNVMRYVDLVVAVSDNVLKEYRLKGEFQGEGRVLPNGCDFPFWKITEQELQNVLAASHDKIVFYQGGINSRLDFSYLEACIGSLPQWKFVFCGRISNEVRESFETLLKAYSNLEYRGYLSPEEIRKESLKAAVGWMPFRDTAMIRNSLPLKFFEYLSVGLPVVSSVSIEALNDYSKFLTVVSAEDFSAAVLKIYSLRYDENYINFSLAEASKRSYDENFVSLLNILDKFVREGGRKNILILSENREFIREAVHRLRGIEHNLSFAVLSSLSQCHYSLSAFGAICFLTDSEFSGWISESYMDALQSYGGLKILAGNTPGPEAGKLFVHLAVGKKHFFEEFNLLIKDAPEPNYYERRIIPHLPSREELVEIYGFKTLTGAAVRSFFRKISNNLRNFREKVTK